MMMKLAHIKIMHICVFKLYIIGFEGSTMWPIGSHFTQNVVTKK